jgi:hypothetical protein
MFESNFPVDRVSYRCQVFWNACKRLTAVAFVSRVRTAIPNGAVFRSDWRRCKQGDVAAGVSIRISIFKIFGIPCTLHTRPVDNPHRIDAR